MKGAELKGRTYEPLFPYYAHLKEQGAFKVGWKRGPGAGRAPGAAGLLRGTPQLGRLQRGPGLSPCALQSSAVVGRATLLLRSSLTLARW